MHIDANGRVTPGRGSLAKLLEIKGWDSPYRSIYARARANLDRKLKVKMKAIGANHEKLLERLPQ